MQVILLDTDEKPGRVLDWHLRVVEQERATLLELAGISAQRVRVPAGVGIVDVLRSAPPTDVVAIVAAFKHTPEQVLSCIEAARNAVRSGTKVVVLDWFDPCNTPHLSVLPKVDAYLKNMPYADLRDYTKTYVGGSRMTQVLCGKLGYDLAEYEFGSVADERELGKIRPAWNYGVDKAYRRLMLVGRFMGTRWRDRVFDIGTRFGATAAQLALSPDQTQRLGWYKRHRLECLRVIETLRGKRTMAGPENVSPRSYYYDMMRTKVVFSPFGYGEVCFRDYEAVCCGALLVKPAMDHVRATPDIFVPYETYVPVQWDLSDVVEKVSYYLDNPAEGERIANNAQRWLRAYYKGKRHVLDIARAFEGL